MSLMSLHVLLTIHLTLMTSEVLYVTRLHCTCSICNPLPVRRHWSQEPCYCCPCHLFCHHASLPRSQWAALCHSQFSLRLPPPLRLPPSRAIAFAPAERQLTVKTKRILMKSAQASPPMLYHSMPGSRDHESVVRLGPQHSCRDIFQCIRSLHLAAPCCL